MKRLIPTLLILLVAAGGSLRASEFITAPAGGASATVTQPHVTAELIPERTTIAAGQPFDVALHLHADAGWHTYWINPGDAGLATTIAWTLPPGFTAGPIQWPTPEKHAMGPLVTYGYAGDVYLLTTITPPKGGLPQHFDVKAKARWLVCQEECVPGEAELTVPLDAGMMNLRLPVENTELFAQARERMPVANLRWDVDSTYATQPTFPGKAGQQGVLIHFKEKTGPATVPTNLRFFPEQGNVLSTLDADQLTPLAEPDGFTLPIVLEQNGDTAKEMSGVLVSDQNLMGNAKAVHIETFAVMPNVAAAGGAAPEPAPAATGTAPATAEAQPVLIAVLGAAFVGGLILNLMPCVLPVLSLKVFSLMKHAGNDPKAAWLQGVAFTAGVVISFWVLAGLLISLQTAGQHLGWGFQMQNPGFVLALIFIFFLLGLNLFGVFELGASLVGLDAKATGKFDGTLSSFLNGALATLAATPCTAPFMGSSLGFAAQQPPWVALLVFTFLALGMASPYLLLTIFPGALRLVPKPGAWMEAFKQLMGFLLMGTVIFLVYVFGALVGEEEVPWLLGSLLLAGLAAWIYGRWGTAFHSKGVRGLAVILALGFLGLAIFEGVGLARARGGGAGEGGAEGWQVWSQAAVDGARAQGRPVFVDFTAAWCLSCKVNEAVALGTDGVKQAFAAKNVALFRADWTHADPEISKALRAYDRDGVPLYLYYSGKGDAAPAVLPEVLTPGIVLEAVNKG